MKNLYFILFILLIGCKEKDPPKPESKTAPLLIEFTADAGGPIYCNLFLSPIGENSEYFTSDTTNPVSYIVDKPQFKGGRSINFGLSSAYYSSGPIVFSGSYTIKITYNNQILANKNFSGTSGVSVTVDLPFIN
jgi:hypothetical protein